MSYKVNHPNWRNVRYFRERKLVSPLLTKADYYGNDKHIGHVSTNGQCPNGSKGRWHALYRLPGSVNNWNVPQSGRAALWARHSRLYLPANCDCQWPSLWLCFGSWVGWSMGMLNRKLQLSAGSFFLTPLAICVRIPSPQSWAPLTFPHLLAIGWPVVIISRIRPVYIPFNSAL